MFTRDVMSVTHGYMCVILRYVVIKTRLSNTPIKNELQLRWYRVVVHVVVYKVGDTNIYEKIEHF